jgi:hypothetical protein
VQPTQLSLLPDQVPAPPTDLASQFPASARSAVTEVLGRLISQAVRVSPALDTPAPHTPTAHVCTPPEVSHGE